MQFDDTKVNESNYTTCLLDPKLCDSINILPLIEGVMVDYHTQKTNIIRDEVEDDIVDFYTIVTVVFVSLLIKSLLN
jgi:hypothetical protein